MPHKETNYVSKSLTLAGMTSACGRPNGTTGPILVNPINSMATVNAAIGDISAAALTSQNLADYESKLQQLRHNSLSRPTKNRRKIRVHGSNQDLDAIRYGVSGKSGVTGLSGTAGLSAMPTHIHSNIYNQYIEHIYESIDSDSLSSGIYERKNRPSRRPSVPPIVSQINDLYSGANITVNPTHSLVGDDWSQNSSSSYGPLYDDRPLLIDCPSATNSPNLNQPLISQDIHSQRLLNTNLNIHDRSREEMSSFRNTSRTRSCERSGQNSWNISPNANGTGADLPDVVQDPIDASNNITTVFVDGNMAFDKRLNVIAASDCQPSADRHQVLTGLTPNTYC